MNSMNDLKFLSKIKLYLDKTLTLKSLKMLTSQKVERPTELISALTNFNIIECIHSQLRLDSLPGEDIIYEKLLLCWINILRRDIEMIQPSKGLVRVFNAFMNRYTVNAFLYSMINKGAKISNHPIIGQIAEAVENATTTTDLLRNLSTLRWEDIDVLRKVMRRYLNKKLSELNPYKIFEEAMLEYYRSLKEEISSGDLKTLNCINHMEIIDYLSKLLRRGESTEAVSKYLNKLPVGEREAIRSSFRDHFKLEVMLKSSAVNYCDNVLSAQVFSVGALLRYLNWKDWETQLISFILSSLNLGYGGTYLKEVMDEVINTYDILNK